MPIAGFSFGVANLYYQKTLAEYEQKVLFQNIEIMKLQRDIESLTRAPKRSVVGEKQPETNDREISSENLKEKVKLTGEKVVLLFDTDLKISPNHYFDGLKNVTFEAVVNGKRHYIDLRFNEKESFIESSYKYSFDLIQVEASSANIIVSREKIDA